jgi:hypothetical protein
LFYFILFGIKIAREIGREAVLNGPIRINFPFYAQEKGTICGHLGFGWLD